MNLIMKFSEVNLKYGNLPEVERNKIVWYHFVLYVWQLNNFQQETVEY